MTVKDIAINRIEVGERLRKINPDMVDQIAKSIALVGLLQPILVATTCSGFYLVAGLGLFWIFLLRFPKLQG
jgi:ParB-like chromosome segregation protein Spo0J